MERGDEPGATFEERVRTALAAAAPTAVLDSFHLVPVATGVGLLSSVWRARLSWSPDGAGPASVIVKQPSAEPGNRRVVEWFGYDRREAGAYRHLLPHAPRLAPVAWLADPDLLVLEDLADHRSSDQIAGAGADDALAVSRALGRLHATFWDDACLATHDWLPGPTDPLVAGYGDLFDMTWGPFCDRCSWLTTEQRQAAERTRRDFDTAITHAASRPQTLLHGDARLDNVLLEPVALDHPVSDDKPAADDPPPVVLIDWQLAARGQGAYDLAFFVSGSLEPSVSQALGDRVLRRYHRALADDGVDVGLDQIEHDLRMGFVQNLPNPITAAVGVAPSTERGRALLDINAHRALSTLVDMGF